ncbi:hypothetical protein [Desulfosporosinus hippei]|uniref:hypothetical protein n=1 Tax=Desulfosporosinus hippei TaxID=569859 RepID=UPI0015A45306|nr:hypothetical protein [Desulfosporosinus hippei]
MHHLNRCRRISGGLPASRVGREQDTVSGRLVGHAACMAPSESVPEDKRRKELIRNT